MKYINKIILLCSAVLILCNSCRESFFEKNPVGYISEGSYWTSENDVKAWMSGTYAGIQTAMNSGCYTLWGEGRSDNFYPTIYDNADYWQLNGLTSNLDQTNWANLYIVIDRCNKALEKLPAMDIAETNKAYYSGQFHAIRALMYFYAIRLWGDVPLITVSWDGNKATLYHTRTPVNDIKTLLIESDLQAAINELDLDVTTILPANSACFYFNKASAMALKMSVNMWFKEYKEALDISDIIIGTKKYSLVKTPANWKNIFIDPQSSTESMLTLNWSVTAGNNKNDYGARLCSSDKNPTFGVSKDLFALLLRDKNDIRLWGVLDTLSIYNDSNKFPLTPDAIVIPGMVGGSQIVARGTKLVKFCSYTVVTDTTGTTLKFNVPLQEKCEYKLPLIRFADVMLMRAEALNKLGRGQEALDIVNQIRQRCGNGVIADIAYYNEERGIGDHSRERCILEERQAEFYGEGNRWFDLLRADDTGTAIFDFYIDSHMKPLQNVKGLTLDGFGDPRKKLLPIYYQAFINNPLLEGHQNPPYSE